MHAVVLGIGFMAAPCLGGNVPADNKSATYEQGRTDRQASESWFAGLTGDFRAGADFWAGHRSDRKPPSCSAPGHSREFVEGCFAAKARLDPTDIRRKAETDYRDGWNSPPSSPSPSATPAPQSRPSSDRRDLDRLIGSMKTSGDNGFLAWLTYWPVIAGAIGAGAVLCWLWLNLPGARQVKAAWARMWGLVRPGFWRVAYAIRRNRGKLWTLSLIAAGALEFIRETVPGQNRVWSATYTAEAVSLLIAALLTISAMPGIIGMFFKPVTWQIIGWSFRMVWVNLYQFGRISVSALVSYLVQFGWVNGRLDPLGDFVVTITSAGNALIAVLRTGDLSQLLLALPPAAAGAGDNIVLSLEWLYLSIWRVAELVCLIVMARYAIAALIGLCRGLFHLIREHVQRQPRIRTQTPHGPPPDDWETIS